VRRVWGIVNWLTKPAPRRDTAAALREQDEIARRTLRWNRAAALIGGAGVIIAVIFGVLGSRSTPTSDRVRKSLGVDAIVAATTSTKHNENYGVAFRSVGDAIDGRSGVGLSQTYRIFLTLQSLTDSAISISDVRVVIDRKDAPIDVAMSFLVPAGSDEAPLWLVSLDESAPVIREILGPNDARLGDAAFNNRTVTLAPHESFTASLLPKTSVCSCSFHLELDMVVDGAKVTKLVYDSNGEPFAVTAAATAYQEALFAYPGGIRLRCSSPAVRSTLCNDVVAGTSVGPIVDFPDFAAGKITEAVCNYATKEAVILQELVENFDKLKPDLPLPDVFFVDAAKNEVDVGAAIPDGYLLMKFRSKDLVREMKISQPPYGVARAVPFYYAGERGLAMRSCNVETR
jgi:hypothetical protein